MKLYKLKNILIYLVILGVVGIIFTRLTSSTSASWLSDDYTFRTALTFGNTGTVQSNQKVLFQIDTATLISASKMQTDCDDTRFTDVNGKSLNYYTNTGGGAGVGCNDASSDYYVLMPEIIVGTNTVYMYYGNPTASSGSVSTNFSETTFSPNSGPTVGTEEIGPAPISYWKFDEGSGSSAKDENSASANHLTTANTTYADESLCISGKCLSFNGTTSIASKAYSTDTELNPGTGSFTVSGWFKYPSTTVSAQKTILARFNSGGYKLYMKSGGTICFGIDSDATWSPSHEACSTATYNDSNWHFISAVKNSTTNITLYIDARQIDQIALTDTSSLSGSSPTIYLGVDSTGNTNYWTGFLDDFKYYNYAKTTAAAQETFNKAEMSARGSVQGVSAQFGQSSTAALNQGLAGYWKFDETSGTLADSSGNNNTGTWGGTGSSHYATGKFGNSAGFNGTDDYVQTANNFIPPTLGSISFWVRPPSSDFDGRLLGQADNYEIRYSWAGTSGRLYFDICLTQALDSTFSTTTLLTDSTTWYHVVGTYNSSTGNYAIYINGQLDKTGNVALSCPAGAIMTFGNRTGQSQYFQGYLDELRFYNRVLSPAEISHLYNWAPGPVAYWNMDEGAGTTSNDQSGNSLHSEWAGTLTSPWVIGKYGKAFKLNGTNNYGSVTHNDLLNITSDITISAWVMPTVLNSNYREIVFKGSNGSRQYALRLNNSNQWEVVYYISTSPYTVGGSTATAATLNQWTHLSWTRSGSSSTLYINGVALATGTQAGSIDTTSEILAIGRLGSTSAEYFEGLVDEVKIYSYARNSKQVLEDMNAGRPVVGSPVNSPLIALHFDEGYENTAYDSSGYGRNFTLSSDSWTPSGIRGSAWNGTGSNRLSITDAPEFDFLSTENFTFSLWIRSDSATPPGTDEYVVSKVTGTSAGYGIFINNTTGTISFGVDDDTTWNPDVSITSVSSVYDATWHHITAVKTGTSLMELYVDGYLEASTTTGIPTNTLANSASLKLGDYDTSNNDNEFTGDIDEFYMYRAALSFSDITLLYNQASSATLGSSYQNSTYTADNSYQRSFCPPGYESGNCAPGQVSSPVADLPFNEAADGCDGSTMDACDISGNASHFFKTSYPAGVEAHRLGIKDKGFYFDGSTSSALYASVSSGDPMDTTTALTIETWIYPQVDSGDRYIINRPTSYQLLARTSASNLITFSVYLDSAFRSLQSTNPLTQNAWNHVVATYDSATQVMNIYINGKLDNTTTLTGRVSYVIATNSGAIKIGAVSTVTSLVGLLDNFRIYSYSLPINQVAWVYNQGKPVAHYKFDECQGTAIKDYSEKPDRSTARLDGVLSGISGGTQTVIGDCTTNEASMWYNGRSGKYSASVNFDGVDDRVDAGDILKFTSTQPATISVWFNVASFSNSYQFLVARANTTGTRTDYALIVSNNTTLSYAYDDAGQIDEVLFDWTVPTIQTGTWHNFTVVLNTDSTVTGYYDGQSLGNKTSALHDDYVSTNFYIAEGTSLDNGAGGMTGQSNFNGKIDDVQVYNYALTTNQIKTLYNQSSAVRFGP